MIQAVSPPLPAACHGSFECYVEADNHLYKVFWEGSQSYPDFESVDLLPVNMSDEMALTWSHSELVGFGSNAVVRKCNGEDFMIVKIAHPTTEARQLIQHEYDFMRNIAELPAPNVDPQPLTDHDGIYGYCPKACARKGTRVLWSTLNTAELCPTCISTTDELIRTSTDKVGAVKHATGSVIPALRETSELCTRCQILGPAI